MGAVMAVRIQPIAAIAANDTARAERAGPHGVIVGAAAVMAGGSDGRQDVSSLAVKQVEAILPIQIVAARYEMFEVDERFFQAVRDALGQIL